MRTFWKMHYDLLENPAFQQFMSDPSWITYLLILSHVYRGNRVRPSNHELAGFYAEGWLVGRPSLSQLAKAYYGRSRDSINRDIRHLEEIGVIDTYDWTPGGGQARLIQVGTWHLIDQPRRQPAYVEILYVDKIFSPEDDQESTYFGEGISDYESFLSAELSTNEEMR